MRSSLALGGVLLVIVAGSAWAAASAASAGDVGKPRPSLMVPLSTQVAVLDVRNLGDHLLAVGTRGHVLWSDDGQHWRQIEAPLRSMLTKVRFFGGDNGWAVGWDHSIIHTADGGRHWQLQHYDEGHRGRPYYDVHFFDNHHGIVIGSYGSYLETQDGGKSWQPRDFPMTDIGYHLNTFTTLNDGGLLITGERGLVAYSDDQGQSWKVLDSPYIGSFFGALPLGEHGAIVFGLRGNAYLLKDVHACKTADQETLDNWDMRESVTDASTLAARGWQHFSNPVEESLFDGIWLQPGKQALLVGDSGVVEQLDMASMSLRSLPSPTDDILASVVRYKGQYIATGRNGFVHLNIKE